MSDSGYIIVGKKYSSEINDDVYILKLNSRGDSIWSKTYGW